MFPVCVTAAAGKMFEWTRYYRSEKETEPQTVYLYDTSSTLEKKLFYKTPSPILLRFLAPLTDVFQASLLVFLALIRRWKKGSRASHPWYRSAAFTREKLWKWSLSSVAWKLLFSFLFSGPKMRFIPWMRSERRAGGKDDFFSFFYYWEFLSLSWSLL